MLMRFDPWREFDRMASQMLGDQRGRNLSMPMDAYRSQDHLVLHLDVPGIDADSIDLTVEKNVLTVTARRDGWSRDEATDIFANERPTGVFTRQVFLGEGLDYEAVEAEYTDGVLTVRVPVLETAKPRKVPISVTSGEREAIEATAS